jgi:glutamate--cysteine ligase
MQNYMGMELSTRILIKEALNRGLTVTVIDREDNFIRLQKGDRVEYIKQATRTSADTYIAPLIMENKEVTKFILKEYGINVPIGVSVQSVQHALLQYDQFIGKGIVIKPKSTNFGKGVVIFPESQTQEEYRKAVEFALQYDKSILVEEFVSGKEYRFLVIGDEVAGVLHRVPANVRGDDVHTIEELVAEKNKDPLRGKGYVTPLEKINLGPVEQDFLKLQSKNISYIPDQDEIVYLRENSNISTGGDSIDYTDDVLEEYKNIAVNAAKAVGAKICGADIIIKDIKAVPTKTNYSIIELNFNPALHIHDFPYQGENRHVEKKVLDLLRF